MTMGGRVMSSKHSTREASLSDFSFDFDEWHRLSQESPEKFERKRRQLCQQFIENSPRKYQRRLQGLMFQIDMNRRKSANPMDSCIRLSGLMWDSFHELVEGLKQLSSNAERPVHRHNHKNQNSQNVIKLELVHSRI